MLIRYTDFEASLTKRKFHANYFLVWRRSIPDRTRGERHSRGPWRKRSEGQIAPVTLDLDETSVEEFVNTAQSLSMFAPTTIARGERRDEVA